MIGGDDDEPEPVSVFQAAKVVASMRAGRIRLSLHFYNTESEIDQLMGELSSILRRESA